MEIGIILLAIIVATQIALCLALVNSNINNERLLNLLEKDKDTAEVSWNNLKEKHKIIDGEVHLVSPMFVLHEGKVVTIKKVCGKKVPVIEKEGICYVVIDKNYINIGSGFMLPIKEKFDELEEVK